MPGGKRMTGVETDAQPRVPVQQVEQGREVLDARGEGFATAGSRLHEQVGCVGTEAVEDRQQQVAHRRHGVVTVCAVDR